MKIINEEIPLKMAV